MTNGLEKVNFTPLMRAGRLEPKEYGVIVVFRVGGHQGVGVTTKAPDQNSVTPWIVELSPNIQLHETDSIGAVLRLIEAKIDLCTELGSLVFDIPTRVLFLSGDRLQVKMNDGGRECIDLNSGDLLSGNPPANAIGFSKWKIVVPGPDGKPYRICEHPVSSALDAVGGGTLVGSG